MSIQEITLIRIEFNSINGFIFDLLSLEVDRNIDDYYKTIIDHSLFGIHFAPNFLYINLFWKQIKIFDKTDHED